MKWVAGIFAVGMMFLLVVSAGASDQSQLQAMAGYGSGMYGGCGQPVASATSSGGTTGGGAGLPVPPVGSWPRQNSLHNPPLQIPAAYATDYKGAAAKYGLPWSILAGIGMIETGHGHTISTNPTGAAGPMAFTPAAWATYGVLAPGHTGAPNRLDPADAIYSAGNLVHQLVQQKGSIENALLQYGGGGARWYVGDVLYYANAYDSGAVGVGGGDGGCSTGDGTINALQKLVLSYAWPQHAPDGRLNQLPGYAAAVAAAKASGHYWANMAGEPASRPDGDHCSAFASLLITNSGWDPHYNYNGLVSQGAGFVPAQYRWMTQHWKALGNAKGLSLAQLQPGDVGISNNSAGLTHVWVYVGTVPGFGGNFAEASYAYGSSPGFAPEARDSRGSVLYAGTGTAYYFRRGA